MRSLSLNQTAKSKKYQKCSIVQPNLKMDFSIPLFNSATFLENRGQNNLKEAKNLSIQIIKICRHSFGFQVVIPENLQAAAFLSCRRLSTFECRKQARNFTADMIFLKKFQRQTRKRYSATDSDML